MYCAVYTSTFLRPLPDSDIIKIFTKYQRLNRVLHINGCMVHHKKDMLHFVEGDKDSINEFYLKQGLSDYIRHAEPIFQEEKKDLIFEYPYVISEALWQLPESSSIPILNHVYLSIIREQLGKKNLALNLFWKCLDEMMSPTNCKL